MRNNDGRVVDYEPLSNGEYVTMYRSDAGYEKMKGIVKSMPSHVGLFVLSNSKRIMNMFVHEIERFYSKKI